MNAPRQLLYCKLLKVYPFSSHSLHYPNHLPIGERNGKSKARVVEEGDDDAGFWNALGGKGPIASAEAGGADVEADSIANVEKTLLKLSDATGGMKISEVAKGKKIKKSLLESSDVFIIDAGEEVLNSKCDFIRAPS
jgi:hypothetical protein